MLEIAAQCARLLAEKYKVKRVYLFGSLTKGRAIHFRSDIDLAVEGLASKDYFPALSALYDLTTSGIEIDLVPLEDAYEGFRQRIVEEGELLYERK